MSNPLLVLWYRIFIRQDEDEDTGGRGARRRLPQIPVPQTSAGIFLVLRRMRLPLVILVMIFAVSVLGLTLIPGEDAAGRPVRMSIFDAFYFMSYTATTIGFGEIPNTFTPAQRMWVTGSIYLAVVGWAYAIGTMLALLQDRGFRSALAVQRFARKVSHLREPFLLVAGYGSSAREIGRSLDAMGRRFVVVDEDQARVAGLEVEAYRADTPGLVGDVSDTGRLALAGLGHRRCEGVLAMTGDEDVNLAVAAAVTLLRPDLPVIARAHSRSVGRRMKALGVAEVVNPFDRFGDHLRILLRSPSSYRLMVWLTSPPGTELPALRDPLPRGRWVVCGYGRFGREITSDLRAEGQDVTVIERDEHAESADPHTDEPSQVMAALPAAVEGAVGFVAATDSDTANLSLVEAARRENPDLYVVARQNRSANSPLYRAVGVDFLMVPAEVIAHETLARLASPVLMSFLPKVPRQSEQWSARLVDRIVACSGTRLPDIWRVRLTDEEAPAVTGWLMSGDARLGDLLRSPANREHMLDLVTLLVLRDGERFVAPDDDFPLAPGDELLLVGRQSASRGLDATLRDDATMEYVVGGRFVPSSWIWRRLTGAGRGQGGRGTV